MRVLVIGVGSIGQRHMRNVLSLAPDTSFIVHQRSVRPGAIPDGAATSTFTTIEEALALAPDCVILSSESALHIEALPALLAANLPMYVEKPIVTTRAELEKVRRLIEQTGYGAPSLVGCNLRFLPSLRAIKQVVDGGEIGRVVRGQFEAGQWLPDWRPSRRYQQAYSADPARGGGVVLDLIHEIDAARWLLGDFDRVRSDVARRSDLEIESDDVAGALLSRIGGPLAVVTVDYVSRAAVRRYAVVGEGGTAVWDLQAREAYVLLPDGDRVALDAGADAFDVPATYVTAMREFLGAVSSGTPTSQPIEEGLASLDLALAVKEAS